MTKKNEPILPEETLKNLFPEDRSDRFFEALYGDAAEGAYDIRLRFNAFRANRLEFFFDLVRRPGKCLACNLTYGLPQVFDRHPVIDLAGLAKNIEQHLPGNHRIRHWELGETREVTRDLHVVPFTVYLSSEGGEK